LRKLRLTNDLNVTTGLILCTPAFILYHFKINHLQLNQPPHSFAAGWFLIVFLSNRCFFELAPVLRSSSRVSKSIYRLNEKAAAYIAGAQYFFNFSSLFCNIMRNT